MTLRRPIVPALRRHLADPWDRSGAYDPLQEAGASWALDLWADRGVTGSQVTSWVDGVGGVAYTRAASAAVTLSTAASLGGRPVVVGNGAGGLTTATQTIAGGIYTCYLWCDVVDATTVSQFLFDSQTGRKALCQTGFGTDQVGMFDAAGGQDIAAAATGAQCLTWLINTTSLEVKRGSTSLGTDSSITNSGFGAAAGFLGNFDASAAFASVKVGRFMIASALHSAEAQTRIRAWGVGYYGVPA